MDGARQLDRVRSVIQDVFTELGGDVSERPSEAVLIRNGFFCGHRFTSGGLQAVWFVEEREVKFFDRDGSMIRVMHLSRENLGRPRQAA